MIPGLVRASGFKNYFVTAALASLALLFSSAVSAGTFTVLGPQSYERGRGEPEIQLSTFSVVSPGAPYYIEIENGPGGVTRVSSAVITINGVEVLTPEDLNQKVGQVKKPVLLDDTNEITVELRGTPRGVLLVKVFGVDTGPPSINATLSPEPNINGWNNMDVVISFDCADAISGIASCSDPVPVSFETDGYVVSGTAIDNAGNTNNADVTVYLDKTAPTITRTWPPADEFSTDRPSIDIEGGAADGLSGVDKVVLVYPGGTMPIIGVADFMEVGELDTDIVAGARWTDNAFVLIGTDRAGNSVEEGFLVRHTQMAHTIPTDPAKTEVKNGLLTSVDRAIVRFEPSVTREQIDTVVGTAQGRVVGYLPATNTAIVDFETEEVSDLNNALLILKNRSEVEVAVPAIFPPSIQFDNEQLPPAEAAAYENIRSAQAKNQVFPQLQLGLDPVNVAVIETGLDDSHGQNNEFADIDFYDLCTPEGRLGQAGTPVDTSTAHGTKITGILAGANNGSGNNGVIREAATSQFGVTVFRMNCGGANDPALVATAMDLIIDGTVGDIDVVSMSFGFIPAGADRAGIRAIYESYFDSPAGRRILWVGGSGNDNLQIGCNEFLPSGLACDLDNVVSVGAYDPADLTRGMWTGSSGAQFGSNWGAGVTISAPGTAVWTATGPGTYGGVSGTSASTPLVAGAAALMLAANPLSPPTVKQLLVSETQVLADPVTEQPEGGLDVLALLQAGRSYIDVVFVSERDGNREIYAMNADGSNQTNLTNNPSNDFWPRWSPDGQQMVFVSTRESNNVDIYVMNADGSGVTRLTTDPGHDTKPSWSPDGRRIAFISDRNGEFRNWIMEKQGGTWSSPMLIPVDAPTYDFAWSPDGLWLLFSARASGQINVGTTDIYKMNVQDGVAATNLTQTPDSHENSPAWYPGEKIVFSNIADLFSMEPDGTARTTLTQVQGMDIHAVWSPYGRKVTFMSVRDGNWEVYVMGPDGSQPTNLTHDPGDDAGGLQEGILSWSPDGDKVIYWSDRDGNLEIYVADVNSLVNGRLTTHGARDYFPQWRP